MSIIESNFDKKREACVFDYWLELQNTEEWNEELAEIKTANRKKLRPSNRKSARQYRISHPDIIRARGRLQQYRGAVLAYLLKRQSGRCYHCQCQLDSYSTEIDHLLPLVEGGMNGLSNLVASCLPCNRKRRK